MKISRLSSLAIVLALGSAGAAQAQANVDAINQSNLATTGNHSDEGFLTIDADGNLREAFGSSTINPVLDTDLDITVGSAIPDSISLSPVPQSVIDISPDYAGYRYFSLADGRLVLIEPDSLNIAVIIP
jgi:hypothetical protein